MECDDSGRDTEGEAEDGVMWDVEEEGREGVMWDVEEEGRVRRGEEFVRAAAESGDGRLGALALPVDAAASACAAEGRPFASAVGLELYMELGVGYEEAGAGVRRMGLGLAPLVRGRGGIAAAADEGSGDDCIAMRVLGDFGGRAAAYRMPAYALTGAATAASSTAKSGPTAATASARGLRLIILATLFRDSISARMRSC